MKPTFLTYDKPLLTAIIHSETPEGCIEKIRHSLEGGAEAIGIQLNRLREEYLNAETLTKIFAACEGKPIYAISYRKGPDHKRTEEECVELMMLALRCGATLCDVMGDLFCPDAGGITYDPEAVAKQTALIEEIHRLGGEALISVHTKRSVSLEENMRLAAAEEVGGADVIKIVDEAESPDEVPAYLEFIRAFTRKSNKKLLFLCSGKGEIIRYIGPSLGVCMYLCVYEHGPLDTKAQPLLSRIKAVRDNLLWE